MSLPIVLRPVAVVDINSLAARAADFSQAARTKLLEAIADKLHPVEQQPEMYGVSAQYPLLRRCVVMPTVSLYYHILPTAIEVVGVYDSRSSSDPTGRLA